MLSNIKNLIKGDKKPKNEMNNVPDIGDLSICDPIEKIGGKVSKSATNSPQLDQVANLGTGHLRSASSGAKRPSKSETLAQQHYDCFEKLGEGAFSEVIRGNHVTKDKNVAIKILSKKSLDRTQQQAVLKEVTILRKLSHENIVEFEEFFEDLDHYYIVQELVSGGEIFNQIVELTYFSEDLARHVICQIAEAVKYLHSLGIVHRDLKPENLLFNPIEIVPSKVRKLRKSDDPQTKKDEGEFVFGIGGGGIGSVKLADFGLSKQIWESNTKTPCGTMGYTAPEIVKDERYSKQVDMWALGCVLYTLLCGFPPFYDEKIDVLTYKISRGQFEFLKPWWDEIGGGAKHCVLKLLCVDSSARYDIDEFFEDPWISEFCQRVPKDLKGKRIYSNYKPTSKKAWYHPGGYSSALVSPAAIALKDAFDVSTAVHRNNEERILREQLKILEEDETEDDEMNGFFDLDMNKSSIISRRRQNGF